MTHFYLTHFVAGADIRPCRIVAPGSAAFSVVEAGTSSHPIGVSMPATNIPSIVNITNPTLAAASGEPVGVVLLGEALVEAGGAVNAGQFIKSDAQGRAVAATGAGNHFCVGVALESAAAAGDFIRVLVYPRTLNL